jgi:hypothetical protein
VLLLVVVVVVVLQLPVLLRVEEMQVRALEFSPHY